jgi:hypothetical protein
MSLEVKEIPVPKDEHPPPPNEILPKHEFTIGIIAPKGAGKTTLMINLLDFYRHYFHSIVIFSPSVANDPKWDYVKNRTYLVENKRLKKFLRKLGEKRKKDVYKVVGPLPADLEQTFNDAMKQGVVENGDDKEFDGKIPENCFIAEYSPEILEEYLAEQQAMVNQIEEHGGSKYVANRLLFIFDDLVGSEAFRRNRRNPFIRANTIHRHLSLSMLQVVQAYREFPATVRRNWSALVLFKNFNEHEIEAFCEEYPFGIRDKNEWREVYDYCTNEPHGFLYYNMQRDPAYRLMKKFDEYLMVGEDDGLRS